MHLQVSSNTEKGMTVTVLVTGAAGFLGSQLVEKLVALGYSVTAIGRCPIPEQFESMKNLVWIEKDIAIDGIESAEIACVDTVFHLAAVTSGTDEWEYLLANEATTVRLLQACGKHTKKMIFASTQMVYGDANHTAVSENFPLHGLGLAYGCSKINSENWLRFFQEKFGGLYITLRFTGFIEGGGMIDYIIDNALRNKPVELLSRGKVCRDYLTAEKGIEAFIAALHYENSEGFELFNIGSGQVVTSYDLAELIIAELNSSSEIILSSSPAPRRDFVFDIKKAIECLNFETGDLQESVRRYASQKKVAFERNERSAKN
jgi:UDP-glucose 4-epimerase